MKNTDQAFVEFYFFFFHFEFNPFQFTANVNMSITKNIHRTN